jgi:protein gp37
MENIAAINWEVVTGCERLTPGCDSCPSYWEYKAQGKNYNVKFCPDQLQAPLDNPTPTKYAVALGSDLFHEAVTPENLKAVFEVMNKASWHWFEVGTKRAERMYCMANSLKWTKNISLAVSVESHEYKWRIEYLRNSPAIVKVISMVPLLGPMGDLDLSGIAIAGIQRETWGFKREFKKEWADDIARQCSEQGVLFLDSETDLYENGEVVCPEP